MSKRLSVFKKINNFALASIILLASFMPLVTILSSDASAATCSYYWTGGGSNGNWSTIGNWSSSPTSNVAPTTALSSTTTGCDIYIDLSKNYSNTSKDDISGLSIANMYFYNDTSSNSVAVHLLLAQNITISGSISETPTGLNSVKSTEVFLTNDSNAVHTITLGADLNMQLTSSFNLGAMVGNNSDSLNLNGHNLTISGTSAGMNSCGGQGMDCYTSNAVITGSGNVAYNLIGFDILIQGISTYVGNTNINIPKTGFITDGTGNASGFGLNSSTTTNTVNIAATSRLDFTDQQNSTTPIHVYYPIIIAGITNPSLDPDGNLVFHSSNNINWIVPHITLNGPTVLGFFRTNSTNTVDVAGLNVNGNCVNYVLNGSTLTPGDPAANGFVGAPTETCVVIQGSSANGGTGSGGGTTTLAPSTPNTGASIKSSTKSYNALTGAIAIILGALLIGAYLKKYNSSRAK